MRRVGQAPGARGAGAQRGKLTAITDEHGMFAVSVPPGDYTVTVYYGDKTEQERVHVGPEALVLHAM